MLRPIALLAAVTVALAVLACGDKAEPTPPEKTAGPIPQLNPPQAAEPVPGPLVESAPKGMVVDVGARPEGIAIDPESHTVGVAVTDPPRLVLLDSRSGKKLREVRLPSSARHVALSAPGESFLVPCEDADRLVEVPLDGSDPIETEVGDNPHDATAIGPRRFVINEFDSTMDVVRDAEVVGSTPTDAQPGGVANVGGLVYVNAVRAYTVEPYTNADEPRALGGQSSGLGTSHVVVGPDAKLALGDTRGQALVVYQTDPRLKFLNRIPLGGTPVGLAWDGKDTMWVTLSEQNEAVPVDLSGEKPVVGDPVASTQTPLSMAVDSATGRLAIAGADDGKVVLVDP
ncbi:MAG: hypothetical protein H0V81_18145 [Solirubrobacterales bacterium]|nr:hypothetical protein [Solirubrobacterales bacterium]